MKLCLASSSPSYLVIYLTIIWCACCRCSESSLMIQHPPPQQLQQQQQQQENVDNEEQLSSYGERLAESSYSFSNAFAREPKEEQSIYSAGINAIMNSDGFLNQMEKFGGHDGKYSPQGPVEMAVHSKKTVEVIPVKFEDNDNGEPQVIEISPYEVPVSIVFKTQTNKLHVNQEHKTEPAEEVKEINSEEEPQRVVHNVYRPVIQEVTEVVQPYRKVVQKVEPVIEEMKTIISKAAPQDGGGTVQPQKSIGQSFFGGQSSSSSSSGGFKGFGGGGGGGGGGGYQMGSHGGSKLGRFSDFPLSQIPYGSEVVNKLAIPPTNGNYLNTITTTTTSNANQMNPPTSSLFPTSGHFRSNSGSSIGDANSSISHVSKLEPITVLDQNNGNNKPNYQYNDIIKQYISNILNIKNENHSNHIKQHQQSKSMSMMNGINANGIKFINLPLKYTPKIGPIPSVEDKSNNNDGNDEKVNKKFKIIKEFRISLNDIKKELGKVQPVAAVSSSASGLATTTTTTNMMKPFASFSVSGVGSPAQYRHQTLQDISNKISAGQQQPSNDGGVTAVDQPSIKRSSRKPDGSEKLSQFSRRSRRNMNNLGVQPNPLRNYHYMNLKRFADETSERPSSLDQNNNGRFRRRMMLANNDALMGSASEANVNLYSMNIHRPRRPIRRY